MTAFKELWKLRSFQQAFRALVDLPEGTLAKLHLLVEGEDFPTVPPEDLEFTETQWTQVRIVLRTLHSIREDEGHSTLTRDIRESLSSSGDGEGAAGVVDLLFQVDPEVEYENLIRRAQYSTLPVLNSIDIQVDFRAVKAGVKGEVALVPVYIVRLTFDELVAGSDAIVFQVPESVIDIVLRRLRTAKDLRKRVAGALPEEFLHEIVRKEVFGDDG